MGATTGIVNIGAATRTANIGATAAQAPQPTNATPPPPYGPLLTSYAIPLPINLTNITPLPPYLTPLLDL